MMADVGAAGAVAAAAAAAAAAEENAAPQYRYPSDSRSSATSPADRPKTDAGVAAGGKTTPSDDVGLVFVPVAEEVTPSDVTVTAITSPSHSVHSA